MMWSIYVIVRLSWALGEWCALMILVVLRLLVLGARALQSWRTWE